MATRSLKEKIIYQKFKEEAQIVTLKGASSVKKVIKWRGRIFMTGSFVEVFKTIKKEYA